MKKVLAISSVLLGAVFLAGCGQQTINQAPQPTTPAPIVQTPAVHPTQPATTTTLPTNWKTYTSKTYNASISLPNDWKLVGVGDGTLYDTNEELFNDNLTTVSSVDKKDVITFTNGPLDLTTGTTEELAQNSKCISTFTEINNQKIKETDCPDRTGGTIPGRYNYEFVGKKLVIITDNKTVTTDKIISLVKFN